MSESAVAEVVRCSIKGDLGRALMLPDILTEPTCFVTFSGEVALIYKCLCLEQ